MLEARLERWTRRLIRSVHEVEKARGSLLRQVAVSRAEEVWGGSFAEARRRELKRCLGKACG
jgi:hypothetical protein